MIDNDRMMTLVEDLARELVDRHWRLAAAESCTGGGISWLLTTRAGSSEWFERGFVTYSNEAKQDLLGVCADTIARHGAVSEATARQMALGALARSRAQAAVSVTGVAGPSGGSADKPVGTVVFGWALTGREPDTAIQRFDGDRAGIREAACAAALEGLLVRMRQA